MIETQTPEARVAFVWGPGQVQEPVPTRGGAVLLVVWLAVACPSVCLSFCLSERGLVAGSFWLRHLAASIV